MNFRNYVVAISAISFIVAGCSRPPKPVELDSETISSVNSDLLKTKKYQVPKDNFLKFNNWAFQIIAKKSNGHLFTNEQIVKTFYLAHHAAKIIIVGDRTTIYEYKKYFLNNQVCARIELQPVNTIEQDTNTVNILFFNKIKQGVKKCKKL